MSVVAQRTIVAVQGVPAALSGLASGVLNTARFVGAALGLAVLSTIAASHTNSEVAAGTSHAVALTDGYQLHYYEPAGQLPALLRFLQSRLDGDVPLEAWEVGAAWPGEDYDELAHATETFRIVGLPEDGPEPTFSEFITMVVPDDRSMLRRLDMPRNFFSGNNCVAEYGQFPDNFLLGVSTPGSDIGFRRQMRSRHGAPIIVAGNPPVKLVDPTLITRARGMLMGSITTIGRCARASAARSAADTSLTTAITACRPAAAS